MKSKPITMLDRMVATSIVEDSRKGTRNLEVKTSRRFTGYVTRANSVLFPYSPLISSVIRRGGIIKKKDDKKSEKIKL